MRVKNGVAFFPEPDAIEVLDKKVYQDGCYHHASEYIGSVVCCFSSLKGRLPVDVYLHNQDGFAHVCIRYGEKDSEYASAGHVLDFLIAAANPNNNFAEAATLILSKTDFFCELKPRV
jgi:hypothetical protein